MDYSNWVEMQQNPNANPNPNSDFSLLHTPNHSHNLVSEPYQPSAIDSQNALYLPQPQPPGVDPLYVLPPPYVPPVTTVNHAKQPINHEPQQTATVSYAQQPIGYEPQRSADAAAAASHYPDPNVSWAAPISQFVGTHYAAGVSTPNPTIQLQRRHTWKKSPKKTKVVQSAWCEVCKIDCNSKGVLDQHKLGKKHLKNLEKLKTIIATTAAPTVTATTPAIIVEPPAVIAASPAATSASTSLPGSALALASTDKPIIGPEENPEKPKPSNAQKSRKKAAARMEDLETKKKRVLEGGAAADSVRACNICNVVCNSDTVFNYHLAGQKHASMIKKHAVKAGVAFAMRN